MGDKYIVKIVEQGTHTVKIQEQGSTKVIAASVATIVDSAFSSSYALSASHADIADSALNATSASFSIQAATASVATTALTASGLIVRPILHLQSQQVPLTASPSLLPQLVTLFKQTVQF